MRNLRKKRKKLNPWKVLKLGYFLPGTLATEIVGALLYFPVSSPSLPKKINN